MGKVNQWQHLLSLLSPLGKRNPHCVSKDSFRKASIGQSYTLVYASFLGILFISAPFYPQKCPDLDDIYSHYLSRTSPKGRNREKYLKSLRWNSWSQRKMRFIKTGKETEFGPIHSQHPGPAWCVFSGWTPGAKDLNYIKTPAPQLGS